MSTGLSLDTLAADPASRDPELMARLIAPAFFLVLGSSSRAGELMPGPTRRFQTISINENDVDTTSPASAPGLQGPSPARISGSDFWLFPVRPLETSHYPFISVGRVDGNDIVLRDETVSKFHAYLKRDAASGAFVWLQDGRSQNGTFVDGERVARRGEGDPSLLRTGQNVRFGRVSLAYLAAAEVHRLMQGITRAAPLSLPSASPSASPSTSLVSQA